MIFMEPCLRSVTFAGHWLLALLARPIASILHSHHKKTELATDHSCTDTGQRIRLGIHSMARVECQNGVNFHEDQWNSDVIFGRIGASAAEFFKQERNLSLTALPDQN